MIYLFSKLFQTILLFLNEHSSSRVCPQDDSDDEPPAAKRTHGRRGSPGLIEFSCEEGEETASSDVHSEVLQSPHPCGCVKLWNTNFWDLFVCFQENELDGSELDSSNDEEEWNSDTSRYNPIHNPWQKNWNRPFWRIFFRLFNLVKKKSNFRHAKKRIFQINHCSGLKKL